MAEAREADRHVRLGAGHEAFEGRRLGQGTGRRRDERDEALAEGDDLASSTAAGARRRHGGDHQPGALADPGRLAVAEQPATHPDRDRPRGDERWRRSRP